MALTQVKGSALDQGIVRTFDSVADMVASTGLSIGDKVQTLGYSSAGDGGGNIYSIVAAGTGTADGGSFIDLTGISGQAKGLFVDGVVNVKQFGAKGDGIADDAPSAQAAEDYVNSVRIGGSTATGLTDVSMLRVYYPMGKYRFASSVGVHAYAHYVGDESSILPDTGVTAFINADSSGFWRFTAEGLTIQGGTGFVMDNSNLDTGKIVFNRCKFIGCTKGLDITCQSSTVHFINCTFFRCETELDIHKCDLLTISGGWIKQGDRTANQQAGIINRGKLVMENVIGVPGSTGGFAETAWINNIYDSSVATGGGRTGLVILKGCKFGGESGSKTVVNNYATALTGSNILHTGVIVRGCDIYTVDGSSLERGAVRLFDVPNYISIKDCTGFVDSYALTIGSGVDIPTLISGKEDVIKVEVDNAKMPEYSGIKDPTNNLLVDLRSATAVSKIINQTAFSLTVDYSTVGYTFVTYYSGGSSEAQLPAAKKGMRYTFFRSDSVPAGFFYRIKPATGEKIRGKATDSNYQLEVDWEGVELYCVVDGFWEYRTINVPTTKQDVATTSDLDSLSSLVNTEGKYEGKQVFNTTTNKPVYAVGSSASSVWVDATGATAHTPA